MHAFVTGHTGMQPQSSMAVLQNLQVGDANSLLATVHMHSIDTCNSLLRSHEEELKEKGGAGLQDEATHEGQPPPGTAQNMYQNRPEIQEKKAP